MVRIFIALYMIGVLCVIGFLADARDPAPGASSAIAGEADASFLQRAALNGIAQIELGRLAAERATDGEVRQLGHQIVAMHTPLLEDLHGLAAARGIEIAALSSADHGVVVGQDFDREFLEEQIVLHERAIELLSEEASAGADSDLRVYAWASATMTGQRLARARQLLASLGSSGA